MRNIYMGSGNYFENLENKYKDKEDRNIIRPEINSEEIFKTGEVSLNVSESLHSDIFSKLNENNSHKSGYSNPSSIKSQADVLVNKIINYCDEVLPAQTIKEIEDKFKKENAECEYIHFDLTFIRFINILKTITPSTLKEEKLNKISDLIDYLESYEEIKQEFLSTNKELKESILSLKKIEEGLVHYTFKVIDNYFACLN